MIRLLHTLAPALALALVLPACIIESSPDDYRDMRLVVSFEGLGCGDARLDRVRVTFETGERSPEEFRCTSGLFKATFRDVPIGTVRVFVEGIDGDYVAYSGRFDLTHTRGGTHRYDLDLLPSTEVVTYFTFAGLGSQDGLTCDEAQIQNLKITFGNTSFDVPCQTNGADAALLTGIDPGTYAVTVDAFDSAGQRLYSSGFDIRVYLGSNEYTLNLLPLVLGGLSFEWEFSDAPDCARAGVATIEYQLVDAAGREVYSDTTNCGSEGVLFAHDDPAAALDPGLYVLTYIYGVSANGINIPYEATRVPLYVPAGRTQGFIVTLD